MHSQQTLLILTTLGLASFATAFSYGNQHNFLHRRDAGPVFEDDLFYNDLSARDAYAYAEPYAYAYAESEPEPFLAETNSIARREAYIDALEQLLYARMETLTAQTRQTSPPPPTRPSQTFGTPVRNGVTGGASDMRAIVPMQSCGGRPCNSSPLKDTFSIKTPETGVNSGALKQVSPQCKADPSSCLGPVPVPV